jgi:hypothetical protein
MRILNRIAIAAAVALLATAAQAADSGLYIGAGTGQAMVEDQPQQAGGQTFDESSTSYRGFVGYRFGLIPILDFAAEVGYSDLGKAEKTLGGSTVTYQTKGADGAILAIFPILGFDFFGKVGAMQYDLDKTFNGTTTGYSGTAPLYGVGLGFRFWRLGIRADYDRIDIDEVKSFDVGKVSVTFRF